MYAVADQLFANDDVSSPPQTDVLRIVLALSELSGEWTVADVTVLQGPTLSSGSGSGPPSGSSSTR